MTENDYLIAWGLYAFAALGCLLVIWRMTGWMWRYLREPLRVLGAVLLLTPTVVDAGRELYAPAVAVTALDLVFKVGSNVWQAISDLAAYGLCALAVYVLLALIRWPFLRRARERREAQQAAAQAQPADAEDEPFDGDARLPRQAAPATAGQRVEPRL